MTGSWGDSGEAEGEAEGCDRCFVPNIIPNNSPPMIALAAKNDPKANRVQGVSLSVALSEKLLVGVGEEVMDGDKFSWPTTMVAGVGRVGEPCNASNISLAVEKRSRG